LCFDYSVADEQKQLNLKLGPNTVQFSVTSSYSGLAGCSARIFMWDSTDQIVISDIDGTITK
jgi:phosphatidate phosphatase LPIN